MRPLHGIDVERVRAFADAVFAIAITFLALEITVPEHLPSAELGHALEEALPSIAGYLLSFMVVGALWIAHHRLFRAAEQLDGPLMYLDLALMALVAVLPFPTKLITRYHSNPLATTLYAGTIALSALLITVMALWLRSRPALRSPGAPYELIAKPLRSAVGVIVIFGSSLPVALISPDAAEYWWVGVGIPVRLYNAWRQSRAAKHAAAMPPSAPTADYWSRTGPGWPQP
ncbi:TMEM175 family protein [Streptomyces sp. NPDC059152]|uniref:TMEM175 family protein n=1 Tax=Streptomyces sp. NPDC059152 TaxID=3346742 RepID=UPI0036BEFF2D